MSEMRFPLKTKIIMKDLIFRKNTKNTLLPLLLYSNITCTVCCLRHLRKLLRDFLENFDRRIYFSYKSCSGYMHSIDRLCPHARNIQWSLCAKSFRSFTRNFYSTITMILDYGANANNRERKLRQFSN